MLGNAASLRGFLHASAFELVLAAGIFLVLGGGLVARTGSRYVALGLTVATLVGATGALLGTAPVQPRGLFGGLLARDAFGDFFKLLAAAAAVLVALMSLASEEVLDHRDGDRDAAEYGALLLAVVLGAGLMASATDLLTVTLSIELVSILSYVLAAFSRRTSRSAESGLKYVIYGGVATAAMLYGFSLLYGLAGSTDLAAAGMAAARAPVMVGGTALALVMAGFGFKLAIVPFHTWCPDVYEGAPTPIAAFFSIVPKAAGFALAYRFFLGAGFQGATDAPTPATVALAALAVVAMTFGTLAALAQQNIKRLLAYSSIAHAGNLLLAFVATPQAGLPPLAGVPSLYAVIAAVGARGADGGGALFFALALVAVLITVISLAYYARVARVMYFGAGHPHAHIVRLAPLHTVLLLLPTIPTVLLGVY